MRKTSIWSKMPTMMNNRLHCVMNFQSHVANKLLLNSHCYYYEERLHNLSHSILVRTVLCDRMSQSIRQTNSSGQAVVYSFAVPTATVLVFRRN